LPITAMAMSLCITTVHPLTMLLGRFVASFGSKGKITMVIHALIYALSFAGIWVGSGLAIKSVFIASRFVVEQTLYFSNSLNVSPFLIVGLLIFYYFARTKNTISRWEGLAMLALYGLFLFTEITSHKNLIFWSGL